MAYASAWLHSNSHLGLIAPCAVLPLERNLVLNPAHPAMARVQVVEVFDFTDDGRMFQRRT